MILLHKMAYSGCPPKAEVEGSNPFGSANFPAAPCTPAPRTAREQTRLPDTHAARVFFIRPSSTSPVSPDCGAV